MERAHVEISDWPVQTLKITIKSRRSRSGLRLVVHASARAQVGKLSRSENRGIYTGWDSVTTFSAPVPNLLQTILPDSPDLSRSGPESRGRTIKPTVVRRRDFERLVRLLVVSCRESQTTDRAE